MSGSLFTASQTNTTRGGSYRWPILAVIVAGQVVASAFYLAWPALTTFLRDDFDLNHEQVGLAVGAIAAGSAIGSVPLGGAGDRFGARRVLIIGLFAMAIASALATLSPTFVGLLAGTAAAGIAYGALNPAGVKVLVGWFPPRQLGTAIGFKQFGYPLGGALAAAILPGLTLAFGSWRSPTILVSVVIVAVALVSFAVIPGQSNPRPRALTPTDRWWTPLLRRNVILLGLAGLLYAGIQGAWLGYLVLYSKEGLGLPVTVAASLLAVTQFAGALGRLLAGVVSDRLFGGRRRGLLIVSGLGGCLASGALPLLVSPSPLLLGLLVVTYGVFALSYTTPQFAALATEGGDRSSGVTVGFGMGVNSVGNLFFPPVFGRIVDTVGSYTPAWNALAVASLIGVLLVVAVRERAGGEQGAVDSEK